MTRHSPSEAAVGNEIPVSGLHANFTLLTAFNDAVGKEVLLELIDGSVFSGIFGGASSDMEVGLYCAYEKTPENEKNLLPLKKDIVQKRQFAFSDIVCVTVPTVDEKMIRGFATDRDYHNKRKVFDEDHSELEAWEGDGEDVDLEHDEPKVAKTASRNGGWGVTEMFAANQSLGVKTTFEDNLSQYTTAEVEGTAEDRRRAEEIARQIEKSGSSRMYSALENDDEERDLDKMTEEAELLGNEARNKNAWSNGSSSITNNNTKGINGGSESHNLHHTISPRPPSLMNSTMNSAPPGFTTVLQNGRRKGAAAAAAAVGQHDHNSSFNTYLPLAANRSMNNNGRGGSQMAPKNNRAEGLKGDSNQRRSSGGGVGAGAGGAPPPRNAPMASPKGGQQQGYAKRDQYDGQGTGGGQGEYGTWNNPKGSGGMKTYESNKFRDNQNKMVLENRNTSNSPRGAAAAGGGGGPPSGPATPQGQKGGTSRVEGLKAWQNDFNPTYRETRQPHKGNNEKPDSSIPQSSPVLESVPPTKNAWQSGPPSGLTAPKTEEKSVPSPSTVALTPAEAKAQEEREMKEEVTASTSHEEEKAADTTRNTDHNDADQSKDSSGSKKFSFNPDAPAFTPKLPSGGGMGGGPPQGMGGMGGPQPTQPIMMQSLPLVPTLMPTQAMNMQGQMGSMGGMQQPMMQSYYPPSAYTNMQPGMQFSAVVNGGGIMAGAAQNGVGQGGGAPSTPRGVNGGQGGVMGGTPRQTQNRVNGGGGGGATPASMAGSAMYVQPQYQNTPMQTAYMATPQGGNYYSYPVQQPMMGYQMPMGMQQQGMMPQPQRGYPVPTQGTHQQMLMYGGQYGGPPGVAPPHQQQLQQQQQMQQGGVASMGAATPQGGPTPSVSSTNGGSGGAGGAQSSQSMQGGGGQGGPQNGMAHPPSQPPTPGAVQQQQGGGPQGGGMQPVPSPNVYGVVYPQGQMMYYGQGGPQMGGGGGGGHEMHEGGEGQMHPMQQYQYNNAQFYQSAPPHLVRGFQMPPHGMQQQQHQQVQPSQSQN